MDSKQVGLVVIAFGIALIVYELFFSFCSERISNLCYFPLSASEPGIKFPWYSIAIFAFGLLIYFGSGSSESKKEDSE
ncbi:MAG TPA: hypothetical protein VJH23_01230 [archaeon]|nr:hypothetical protein [archaeon]